MSFAILVGSSVPARADTPPFDPAIDVQTFEYAIGPKTFFTVTDGDVAAHDQLAFDGLVTFLTKPFKIYTYDPGMPNDPGAERVTVVDSLVAGQLTAAYGVSDKLQIGANLPVIFAMSGDGLDPATAAPAMDGLAVSGLGDLVLEGKLRLHRAGIVRVAGLGALSLPTSFGSGGSQFIGDNLPTLRAAVALQLDPSPRLSFGANAGVLLRKPRTIYDSTIGEQLTWGVAGAVRVTDRFSIVGESYGRAGLPDFSLDASPLEVEAGVRVYATSSVAVVAGGGTGLVRGIGSPEARVFFSVGYAPDVRDSDGDGVPNSRDQCPLQVEDKDHVQDDDGCPDDDNDGDLRPDAVDKCPSQAEDLDGFEDDDGCPELDNDKDGIADLQDKCILDPEDGKAPDPKDGCPAGKRDSDGDDVNDALDKCPSEAEDKDGFEDGDGCPELDNDADGVADTADACPVCPEDKDGVQDGDGCPESDNDVVKLDGDRLVVSAVPTLQAGKLSAAGAAIVDQMALVMVEHGDVTKWLVAIAQPNAGDATKLADAVKARLLAKGVPADRLQVLGAAGAAKLGGVAQERGERLPMCPGGREVKPKP
ncbi:MAG TPA: thrombospondin type 3 repeat-containing protein [Kofleriaceae bacterium]|nr:thrombospondin type 3 repeat-containing protein [Kofleriaceae bacterium]